MTAPIDLAALLAPLSIAEFTRSVLGNHSLTTRNGPRSMPLKGLPGWPEFNELISTACLGFEAGPGRRLEVIVGERKLGADDLCRPAPVPGAPRTVDPALLTHAARSGARLVVHDIDAMNAAVARLSDDIGRHLRMSVRARIEASWQSPWPARFEPCDVDCLIVQLAGGHRCQSRPGQSRPGTAESGQESDATPLKPGAVTYVPQGWMLRNGAVQFPALQLFLDLSLPTGSEFVHWVAARLLEEDGTLRESLPDDPKARAREERRLAQRLAHACEDPTLVDRFRTEMDQSAFESRARFGFPWTATQAVLPPGHVPLRLNGPRFPRQRDTADGVEIHMRGGTFEVDRGVARVLKPIFAGESRTVDQLLRGRSSDAVRDVLVDLLLAGHLVPDELRT